MKIIITGAAGFIGFHCSQELLKRGHRVIGIDNLNDYYDPALKMARLDILNKSKDFVFAKFDISSRDVCQQIFHRYSGCDVVLHLAAQAGVRYSLENPQAYIDANLVSFAKILEECRQSDGTPHLIYASSSSVYGGNKKVPFSESDNVDAPVSLYAATKKANELMAHSYNHLFGIPCTGLRFFTVYGPWGRPDMAYFSFTDKIMAGKEIQVFGNGEMWRDFTYIDDVVDIVIRIAEDIPNGYRIYNIGNNKPVCLKDFIECLEEALGKTAKKKYLPMQPGDVRQTFADISAINRDYGFKPTTNIQEGIGNFVSWYKQYQITKAYIARPTT